MQRPAYGAPFGVRPRPRVSVARLHPLGSFTLALATLAGCSSSDEDDPNPAPTERDFGPFVLELFDLAPSATPTSLDDIEFRFDDDPGQFDELLNQP